MRRPLRRQLSPPEDCIYAMLDAAKAGDAKAYLNSYTGHIKELLTQSASEATPAGFGKYLRTSNAAIQGRRVVSPRES